MAVWRRSSVRWSRSAEAGDFEAMSKLRGQFSTVYKARSGLFLLQNGCFRGEELCGSVSLRRRGGPSSVSKDRRPVGSVFRSSAGDEARLEPTRAVSE